MKQGILEGLLFVTGEDGLILEDIEKLLEVSKEEALDLINEYNKVIDEKLKDKEKDLMTI